MYAIDDHCTTDHKIVASDCICSNFSPLSGFYVNLSKSVTSATVMDPVKIMGKVLPLYRKFKEPF